MLDFKSNFYEKLIRSLDTNAVLMRVENDGRYFPVWCSEEFTKMMEGTEEECIKFESGGNMESIHRDDRSKVAYLFRNHITKNGTNSLDIRKRTVKGNWIWVNVHYSFVEEDGVWYAFCNYFDITEIKKNEKQAQILYESVRAELENISHDRLVTLRLNLTQDVVEDRHGLEKYSVDVKGKKISENISERLKAFPLERDRKKFWERFSTESLLRSFEHGETSITEILFSQRPDGRKCFVEYNVTISQNPQSGDVMAFVTESDYNNKMVNSAVLRQVLVEQYDMITYLVDGNYGVVIGNAARITRGSIFPKNISGNYSEYVENQVKPVLTGTAEEIQKNLDALSLATIEEKLSQKSPYEVNISCLIGAEVFYKRFVFYAVDKEAKFYVLLKSDTTKIQREQIMLNTQLKAALDTANQASIAKTAFLSSISHEIRTPMNAIIGLDSIALKEPNLSARTRSHLRKIGDSAKHLLNLINDILDVSRIESGKLILRNEEFSFAAMLEQINTMVSSQCAEKGLHFDCKILNKVDDYYIGDVMKLKQVLINILGNAVKFTPSGGRIDFIVEKTAQFGGKSTFKFIIKDTGVGMSKEFLPKIFDTFSQENTVNANKYGSSGLGMAITKSIVEMMNGKIAVESEKDVGTTFFVTVTLTDSAKKTATDDIELNPLLMSVLVIDDDPIACDHAKLILEKTGIAAETALSGKEALEMIKVKSARRDPYNLIIVDWKMPDMDGVEVTRQIRSILGDETAIIILTAYNWDDITNEAIEAGVDSFIAKPLFSGHLLDEFKNALKKKKMMHSITMKKADLSGRKVLLAEDMVVNAEIMMEVLKMREVEPELAENGQMAVEMFEKSPLNYYAAILMDMRMPVMDGLQATEKIRALDRADAKTVPIIALTANAFDEDVQRSLQSGLNAHLSKPVNPDVLFDTLENLIKD